MGGSTSKMYQLDNDLQMLKAQLKDLKELDKNDDGVITKDEFITWKGEQKERMVELERKVEEQVSNKYNKMLIEKEGEITEGKRKIEELMKQVEALKTINGGLEKANVLKVQSGGKLQELSKQKVDEFVEKLLSNASVNIGYLPDFVERQIYRNVLNLLIGLLDSTLDSASVKFMGHEVTFNIKPEAAVVKPRELVVDEPKEVHHVRFAKPESCGIVAYTDPVGETVNSLDAQFI